MVKDRFVDYLQFEKRFSPHTVTAYSNDLAQFYEFLKVSFEITDIKEVNHSLIRTWLVKLMEQKIAARSINRKITTLKTFYKFLLREGEVIINPMLKVVAPKSSKRLPEYVEQDKMNRLLDVIEFEPGYPGIRDKMIIELFYATGIRLSELIELTHFSFDFYNNAVKVLGKRNKERIIPMSFHTGELLRAYLVELKKQFPDAKYFL